MKESKKRLASAESSLSRRSQRSLSAASQRNFKKSQDINLRNRLIRKQQGNAMNPGNFS